jgi:PEP-CTERM motif
MFARRHWIILLAAMSVAVPASAGSILYAVTVTGQFGAVNTDTGQFQQIGPGTVDPLGGLVAGPNGYVGVSFSGNLDSVDPATGAMAVIGATGLGFSALDTAALGGKIVATDFGNNLYNIDPTTGTATLIAYTGMPPAPSDPTVVCDGAFFSSGGKLYATFDAFNTATLSWAIAPALYQIDPLTGAATWLSATSPNLNAAVDINGTVYAFQVQPATLTSNILTLDLATGNTAFVASVDPSAGFIDGAAAVPEPGAITLAGIGLAAILLGRGRRKRFSRWQR